MILGKQAYSVWIYVFENGIVNGEMPVGKFGRKGTILACK